MKLPPTKTFADRIKHLRVLRGFTQAQLARACDPRINVTTVSSWERGNHEPRMSRIAPLAKALGATVLWLAEGKGPLPE